MGAYLFDTAPPFEITHFSTEPIVAQDHYDERNGWAFKAIDYIVFPCGVEVVGDMLIISLGRNDHEGWMLFLNMTGLVDSLEPVRSYVTTNRFHAHESYTIL